MVDQVQRLQSTQIAPGISHWMIRAPFPDLALEPPRDVDTPG
jgi:hypothetical protein